MGDEDGVRGRLRGKTRFLFRADMDNSTNVDTSTDVEASSQTEDVVIAVLTMFFPTCTSDPWMWLIAGDLPEKRNQT